MRKGIASELYQYCNKLKLFVAEKGWLLDWDEDEDKEYYPRSDSAIAFYLYWTPEFEQHIR